jgi:hypothetical protein
MTIKNDFKVEVFGDKTPAVEWIDENLPRDAVFLTAWGELYIAPNLAGRGVYLGYDPWVASAGYDAETRRQRTAEMYGASDKTSACRLLLQEAIDYVQIGPQEETSGRFPLNAALFERDFIAAGSADQSGGIATYYDVAASCADSGSVAAR